MIKMILKSNDEENEFMKRCEAIIVFTRLKEVRIYVHLSLCLFLILLFLGAPLPNR